MVYAGPSTGCHKCRERHTKCDGGKPECRRCISIGHKCPGYRDVGGVVFKDVSDQVVQRQLRKARRKQALLPRVADDITAVYSSTLPPMMKFDVSAASVNFFFCEYVWTSEQSLRISRGHFDHLLPLYSNAGPSSPLSLAVNVMAGWAVCLYFRGGQDSLMHPLGEDAAMQAIRNALADPVESLRDETLLAIMCLDFAEQLMSRATEKPVSRVHSKGALALIRHRGPDTFKTDVSCSLLSGTMSDTLLSTLWSNDEPSRDAVMRLPDVDLVGCSPVAKLHRLLMQEIKLENTIFSGLRLPVDEEIPFDMPSMSAKVQDLCDKLLDWLQHVPSEWNYFVSFQPFAPPELIRGVKENGQSLWQIAYIFAQWHCIRLSALKLLYITLADERKRATGTHSKSQRILEGVQASVASLVFLLLHFTDDSQPEYEKHDMGNTLERATSGIRLNRMCQSIHEGGVPHSYYYLRAILTWVIITFTEDMDLADGFAIDSDTLASLQEHLDSIVLALNS